MNNKKIVIIDHDKKSLGDLQGILTAVGYLPVLVDDASLAVDIVIRSRPDVILLELKMPFKNGFEMADEINRVYIAEKVPIIGMSAFFKDDFEFLLNLCGIKRCLKKPLNPLNVIWAVESVAGAGDLVSRTR